MVDDGKLRGGDTLLANRGVMVVVGDASVDGLGGAKKLNCMDKWPLTTSLGEEQRNPETSAYIDGVASWGTGLKLGNDLAGVTYNTHRALGITLFCLGTLQVFALLLRPNKDHKIRIYWNFYHYAIGYATIIINIINIFKGFEALEVSEGDRYNDWKHTYIGIIAALGGIVVLLEA
ncbi:cytochrome b561 and DOMON domain-containing protein At5g35735-like [Vigna umbellata]|uniref:cytochrome b561 and DOMON domain-containing protein At5g35735-like n=1 Tax=Vigna umbellata TaxID=87088 RepID=UPI001F5EDA0A|nr:cytochrome b561 and DOMON domain-containing protein At5g35735-like [Vigna umbellata]